MNVQIKEEVLVARFARFVEAGVNVTMAQLREHTEKRIARAILTHSQPNRPWSEEDHGDYATLLEHKA
jgi:hypothetical protein